jgi:4'-phosphopantetheinyl transferase
MDRQTIRLWQGDCTAAEADYPHFWSILNQTERRHASTLKNDRVQKRYVVVHARLRILLADAANAAPQQLRIHKAEYGKPFLVDYPELAFNLSHTGDKLLVAIAYNCDLGVDIEQCKTRVNLIGLVDKCFAEEEKAYWQQTPEAQQTRAFYQLWTRKEAFVKATGRGIALGFRQCIINPQNLNEFIRIPAGYGQANEWMVQDIDLDRTICGALVVKKQYVNQITRMDVS